MLIYENVYVLDRQADRESDGQTDGQTDKKTTQEDRQQNFTDRQQNWTDGSTDRQAHRKTDSQTDTQTLTGTHIHFVALSDVFQGVIHSMILYSLWWKQSTLWIAQNRVSPHSSRPCQQLLHRFWQCLYCTKMKY